MASLFHLYAVILVLISFVFGIVVIVNSIKFKKKSKLRFISTRKPKLILLYCFLGSIPSLLIISPCKIFVTMYDDNFVFNIWILTFMEEFVICSMSITIALRCWLVYYDHSYQLSVVDKNWRGVINPNDTDFWLKHRKTWGDYGFIICVGIVLQTFVLMLFSIISIYALQYDNNNLLSLHAVSLFVVSVPCYIFIATLIIYGKYTKLFIMNNDKFEIIKEMQYLLLSTLLMIIIYIIEFIDIDHLFLVIETGQIIFCLITSWIQSKWVIKQLYIQNRSMLQKRLNPNMSKTSSSTTRSSSGSSTKPLKMRDVLSDKYGFGMFMRHCQSELNVEGLLFIIEVAQYKAKLLDMINNGNNNNINININDYDNKINNNLTPNVMPNLMDYESVESEIGGNEINVIGTECVLPALSTIRSQNDQKPNECEKFEGVVLEKNWIPIAKEIFPGKNKKKRKKHLEIHVIFENESINVQTEEQCVDDRKIDDVETKTDVDIKWMYEFGQYLFMKYIDVESAFSINVSYQSRSKLLLFFSKKMEKGFEYILNKKGILEPVLNTNKKLYINIIKMYLYHMFDDAMSEVWDLLRKDTFIRFKHTQQYQYLVNKYHKQPTKI